MAQDKNDNWNYTTPKAADNRTGKFVSGVWQGFASIAEANALIPLAYRHRGLKPWVGNVEHVYLNGTADTDLVPYGAGGGGDPEAYLQSLPGYADPLKPFLMKDENGFFYWGAGEGTDAPENAAFTYVLPFELA